jgi:hypothetical protein
MRESVTTAPASGRRVTASVTMPLMAAIAGEGAWACGRSATIGPTARAASAIARQPAHRL